MSCYPLCEISICDTSVKLAEVVSGDAVLHVKKGAYNVCAHELTNDSGVIYLTDTEILDFGDIAHVFTIQLKQDGEIIPLEYYDCDNQLQTADTLKLRFNECTSVNEELNEVCG